MSDLVVKIQGDASGAINALVEVGDRTEHFARETINEIGKIAAAYLGLEKAIEGVREGIKKADEIRDLSLSLDVFTGKVNGGAEALKYFEEQARRTRSTADDLAKIFRDLLPLASSRGFSQGATQDISVMLSQIATVAGRQVQDMEAAFEQLLAGRVSNKNQLFQVLGINKSEFENLGWDRVIEKMGEVASGAEKFGQSFESASAKIKDAWADAFGQGFNASMENGRRVTDELLTTLTDPHIVAAIDAIGGAFGRLAIQIGNAASAWSGNLSGADASGVPPWMQKVADFLTRDFGASIGVRKDNWDSLFHGASGGWGAADQYGPKVTPEVEHSIRMNLLKEESENLGKVAIEADRVAKAMHALALRAEETMKRAGGDAGYIGPNGLPQVGTPLQQQILGMLGGVNGPGAFWSDGSPFGGLLPTKNFNFPRGILSPGADVAPETFAHEFSRHLQDAFRSDDMQRSVSDLIIDAATSGGQRFGEIAAHYLASTSVNGLDALAQAYIPAKGDASKGQDPNKFYVGGKLASNQSVAQAEANGINGLQSGFAGYGAGLSGQSGARTATTIEGALSGFMVGGPIGAIIGGIAAAIGGALGASSRQADYQYGIPTIDASGRAHLASGKNLTSEATKQIEQQVQAEYDQIHDGLINLLTKFPDVAIPSFSEINGKFQDNPSAHWGEHLQQWITGTLPRELMKALGDELATGFAQLGMSKDAFGSLFSSLQGLDPNKAVGLLGSLAGGLTNIRDARAGFGMGFGDWQSKIGSDMGRSPGQLLAEADSEIVKLAKSISSLSPEGQIQAIAQLGQMEKQRYETLKQYETELFNLGKQAARDFEAAYGDLALSGMVDDKGNPDYRSRAIFYRQNTNTDLRGIQGANTATDLQYWQKKFIQDAQAAWQQGIAGGGDRTAWNNWLRNTLGTGETAFNDDLKRLGLSLDDINKTFTSEVDPELKKFTQGLSSTNGAVDDVGKGFRDIIQPISDVRDGMAGLASDIKSLRAALNVSNKSASFVAGAVASRTSR